MQGGDTAELYGAAQELEDALRGSAQLVDVSSDLQFTNPQVNVTLDRPRISALGLTVDQVEGVLFNAFGTRQVSQIYTANNAYQVIMRVAPQFQTDITALSGLYLKTGTGQQVPLSTVATATAGVGPLSVNHTGQLPSVTLSFNLKPGVALGDAVSHVQDSARTILPRPSSRAFKARPRRFRTRHAASG